MTPTTQNSQFRAGHLCGPIAPTHSVAWRRAIHRFVSFTLMVVVAACGSDAPTQPTPASVVGTWHLQTVNGSALPYLMPQDDFEALELTSDVFTVDAKGTFTQVSQFRVTQDAQWSMESVADSGSYALNGATVTFTYESDGSTGIASLAGNTLTFSGAGIALVYKKQ
jgi:hypothetical protein